MQMDDGTVLGIRSGDNEDPSYESCRLLPKFKAEYAHLHKTGGGLKQ
jgi:hypothetical protein